MCAAIFIGRWSITLSGRRDAVDVRRVDIGRAVEWERSRSMDDNIDVLQRTCQIGVTIDHKIHGVGAGHSKQEATQAAAAMTLHRLGANAPEYVPNPTLEAKYGLLPPAGDN